MNHPDNLTCIREHVHSNEFVRKLPEDLLFAWGGPDRANRLILYALKTKGKHAMGPDENDIQEVTMKKDAGNDSYSLSITFTAEGAGEWAALTAASIGRNLAIVVDGRVLAAPKVQAEIRHGKCMITGNFSEQEAAELKAMLGGS